MEKIRIDVTQDADQDVINPDFVRVYKQNTNILLSFEGYTRKYLTPNHEYKLGSLNYTGAFPSRISMPLLITNADNNIYIGYFDISGADRIIRFYTPDFPEKNINYVSGSHIAFL